MKKKLLAVSLVMAMCLLSACGGESNDSKKKDKEEKTTQESHEEEKTEEITVEEEIVEENQGIEVGENGEIIAEDTGSEESSLSDDPITPPTEYGTEDHFAFTAKDVRYEFTATDNIQLFSHFESTMEVGGPMVAAPISIRINLDGECMNLHDCDVEMYTDEIAESEVAFQEENVTLYRYYEDYDGDEDMEPFNRYYLQCGDLLFEISGANYLIQEEGWTEQLLWDTVKPVNDTIKVSDVGEELSLYGYVANKEMVPGYRLAFRPSVTTAWSVMANAYLGNTVFCDEAELVSYGMVVDIDGEYISVRMEQEDHFVENLELNKNYVDTGLRLGDHIIYEDTNDYVADGTFVIVDLQSQVELVISASLYELSPEQALEMFEKALVPIE